jgi:CheY-like chemotaxis protein
MSGENTRILVVDDLPDWRLTIGGLLEDEGYEVQTAGSSEDALELFASEQFDLAVLDVRLDETDEENTEGLNLAAEIRRLQNDAKIVIITGYGTQEIIRQALEPNDVRGKLADNYVPKTETGQLAEIVRKLLDG